MHAGLGLDWLDVLYSLVTLFRATRLITDADGDGLGRSDFWIIQISGPRKPAPFHRTLSKSLLHFWHLVLAFLLLVLGAKTHRRDRFRVFGFIVFQGRARSTIFSVKLAELYPRMLRQLKGANKFGR